MTQTAGIRIAYVGLALLGAVACRHGVGYSVVAEYPVRALFHDASGLDQQTQVRIAGISVGQVSERSLFGDQARVTMQIRNNVRVWSNAAIYERLPIGQGAAYLDLDPGTPESPDRLTGKVRANYPLEGCVERTKNPTCNQIENVVEPVTCGDAIVRASEVLAQVHDSLVNINKLTEAATRNPELSREALSSG